MNQLTRDALQSILPAVGVVVIVFLVIWFVTGCSNTKSKTETDVTHLWCLGVCSATDVGQESRIEKVKPSE